MKIFVALILVIVLAAVLYQVYALVIKRLALNGELFELSARLDSLYEDERKLEKDVDYYKDPRNLEKELRARTNYKAPEEQFIIVLPPATQ